MSIYITNLLQHYCQKRYYEVGLMIEFCALAEILDVVSPYNVSKIPTNCITKRVIPDLCGKSISNRMFHVTSRVLLEDVP